MKALLKPLLIRFKPVIQDYLAKLPRRPGRCRLYPEWLGGPSVEGLSRCVQPLVFDTGIEGANYGIAGTCFLARFQQRLFVVTAGHCLTEGNGNDLRISLDGRSNACIPFKSLHCVQNGPLNPDSTDVAILEVAPDVLSLEQQGCLFPLEFDQLWTENMFLKHDAALMIPGCPKCWNSVDYDRGVIHTQRYVLDGKYIEQTERPGVHLMSVGEMDEVESPDGMSGAPVLFLEEHREAVYFGFLGMVIRGSKFHRRMEFIDACVLCRMLAQIIRANS